MALIFLEGFDAQDMSTKWNGASASTGSPRVGTTGNSMNLPGVTKLLGVQLAQVYIGYGQFCTNPSSGFGNGMVLMGDSGATSHISVRITTTAIVLHAGFFSTILASAPGIYAPNFWYYMEVWMLPATSGGRCQVRVNGQQVIDYTGNTMNGGTNVSVDSFWMGTTNSSVNNYYDDVYVCDATGTTNNTFLGDIQVQTLVPNGAGTSTQLTPVGNAANWQNVKDAPDNTANYNNSSVVGNRDTYAMGDLTATTGTVFGIQDNIHAFKTSAGSANMKAAILSGAALAYDPSLVLSVSNAWKGAIREVDPNTGLAWTPAGLNAVEFGGEVA